MKVKTDNTPLEMGGVNVEGEFRIRNSAKAFNILSSGLYSNKIEAILRELGCNAYDSHVEAGKADVPFTVHLPTVLNPQFYVRDYGIGLDHEGVTQLYTTYFESTKQDSNDYVGCLGLGSKSPFSYTRNFTVTAIKDGVERIYNCFINEQGIPSVALLNEHSTDACNGVEVRFAVKERSDMAEFAVTATRVYKWFKTTPEIIGNPIEIPEVKYSERDIAPGIHIVEDPHYRYHCQSYAMMGNVVYPIKLPKQESVPHSYSNLVERNNYLFEFEIGELDVAASREELSYDAATVAAIVSKIKLLFDSAVEYISKEAIKEKTNWARVEKLLSLVRKDRFLFDPALDMYLMTANNTLKKMLTNRSYDGAITLDANNLSDEKVRVTKTEIQRIRFNNDVRLSQATASTDYSTDDKFFRISTDTIFLVQNDKGNLLGRLRQAARDRVAGFQSGQTVFIIRKARRDGDPEKVWRKVAKRLGNPPVVYSNTLPPLEKAIKTKDGEVKAYSFSKQYVNRWDGHSFKFQPGPKKLKDFHRINGKIVYIPLHGKQAKWGNDLVSTSNLLKRMVGDDDSVFSLLNENSKVDINHKKVYGVNGESLKTAEKSPNWVSLQEFILEQFNQMDWKSLEGSIEAAARAEILNHEAVGVAPGDTDTNPLMSYDRPNSPYSDFVKVIKNVKQDSTALVQLRRLQMVTELLPTIKGKVKELQDLRQKTIDETKTLVSAVRDRYPLLRFMRSYGVRHEKGLAPALKEYIEAIDRING